MSSPVAAATTRSAPLALAVLLGSVREGRFGHNLANKIVSSAKALGHNVTLYDAKELNLPAMSKPFHHYKGGDEDPAPAWLADLASKFEASDAFIFVDGEYNFAPTPGMINMIDFFHHRQFKGKAAGLATYGAAAGGARAGFVLRNTLAEVGLVVAPTSFMLPNVWSQFNPDGELSAEVSQQSLTRFLTEFSALATVLRDNRKILLPSA